MGTNGLIGVIVAPLGDCLLGNKLGIVSKRIFKKIFTFKKKSLYYFVKVCVKNLSRICHFQSFPNPFTSFFTT